MLKSFALITLLFPFLPPPLAHADFAADVIAELGMMKNLYREEYAPLEWKKQFFGYDLDAEYAKAVAAVEANSPLSVQASREIFNKFIYAMRDYHTSVEFASSEKATLPLLVKGTGAREFIVYIDRKKLPENSFPFHVGDELVSFSGKPVLQAIAEMQAQYIANIAASDFSLAELRLTSRSGALGVAVPQGPITLGIRPSGAKTEKEFELIWDYTPEGVAASRVMLSTLRVRPNPLLHPKMMVDIFPLSTIGNPYEVGGRYSFIPLLGKKIWESEKKNAFYAYIYRNAAGKSIGYVRIGTFDPDDPDTAVSDFAKIIKKFESSTAGIVVDEGNNPGGSVTYLYALASMLAVQPLRTPLHRMAIDQTQVAASLTILDALKDVNNETEAKKALDKLQNEETGFNYFGGLDGYPESYELAKSLQNLARFIVKEWAAGRHLTNPYWMSGIDDINPAPIHYSKPILLLTDHLDFSAADFFPAILQDNHRATILGSRTGGAGGLVHELELPNDAGVSTFSITQSIAERANGNPIENLGVIPDLIYEITDQDYTENYAPYAARIKAAIGSLLK